MISIDTMVSQRSSDVLAPCEAPELQHLGPVAPVAARMSGFDAWTAYANPGDLFRHPREVLAHPGLNLSEKRGILASWASDACAVESCPGLRCLVGCRAEPVPLDAVLDALQALDDLPGVAAPAVLN